MTQASVDWPDRLFACLKRADVRQVGYVPDAGHSAMEPGIRGELVAATERLRDIHPAVSIFGSARTPHDHPYYKLTEEIARLLSDAGFSVISGGGPGIMEAANRGAHEAGGKTVGLNIGLPFEQLPNPSSSIWAIMLWTRCALSGCPCGSRAS